MGDDEHEYLNCNSQDSHDLLIHDNANCVRCANHSPSDSSAFCGDNGMIDSGSIPPYTAPPISTSTSQLSPHNISDQVSSTVHRPTTENGFQHSSMEVTINSLPNSTSSTTSNSTGKCSFYCPICQKSQAIGKRIMRGIMEHLDTHLVILCPLCNCNFHLPNFSTHLPECRSLNDGKRQCSICNDFVLKKKNKHILQHISTFNCPVAHCKKMISMLTKHNHIIGHIHEKSSKKYELLPMLEKKTPSKSGRRKVVKTKSRSFKLPRVDVPSSAQSCDKQVHQSNIQNSVPTIGPEMPPTRKLRSHIPEKSTGEQAPRNDIGDWEKHTKGIGFKLMSRMGYVPGRGLGPRGEGVLEPLEAVVLPKGANLDRIMCMRAAGTLFGKSKRVVVPKWKPTGNIDTEIQEKTEHLKGLIDTIRVHEEYLTILQSIIKESSGKLNNLSDAINEQMRRSPVDTIEISDGEERGAKEIGPQFPPNASSRRDSIIISSDDAS